MQISGWLSGKLTDWLTGWRGPTQGPVGLFFPDQSNTVQKWFNALKNQIHKNKTQRY